MEAHGRRNCQTRQARLGSHSTSRLPGACLATSAEHPSAAPYWSRNTSGTSKPRDGLPQMTVHFHLHIIKRLAGLYFECVQSFLGLFPFPLWLSPLTSTAVQIVQKQSPPGLRGGSQATSAKTLESRLIRALGEQARQARQGTYDSSPTLCQSCDRAGREAILGVFLQLPCPMGRGSIQPYL